MKTETCKKLPFDEKVASGPNSNNEKKTYTIKIGFILMNFILIEDVAKRKRHHCSVVSASVECFNFFVVFKKTASNSCEKLHGVAPYTKSKQFFFIRTMEAQKHQNIRTTLSLKLMSFK